MGVCVTRTPELRSARQSHPDSRGRHAVRASLPAVLVAPMFPRCNASKGFDPRSQLPPIFYCLGPLLHATLTMLD